MGEGLKDSDEAFPLQHWVLQKSTFTSTLLHTIFICMSYNCWLHWTYVHHTIIHSLIGARLTVEQIVFGFNFKMGVMQRALRPTMGGLSLLRTSFVAALIALCLNWSNLSLDMSRIRSTVVCSFAVVEKS